MKKQPKVTKNDMIIYEVNQLDITDLTDEQLNYVTDVITDNINIKELEDKIHECILNLTGVGGPNFGADATYIALDNQKRLELVHQLLYYLDIVKGYTQNFKKHKRKNTYIDSEQRISFLVKDFVNTIWNYGEYKEFDKQEQIRQLEEAKQIRMLQLEEEHKQNLWKGEELSDGR